MSEVGSLNWQLVKLGDMMGDGLHHEPGGEWIEKEYARILRMTPEYKAARAKVVAARKEHINERMKQRCEQFPCSCGGTLEQVRSGAMIARCPKCGNKYKLLKRGKP